MRADNEDVPQLTDRFEFDGEEGLSHLVGHPAPVIPVVLLPEVLDHQATPHYVPLLALHYREVPSAQLVALHGGGSNTFKIFS